MRELLATVYDQAGETTHAAYPTATKTLCGVETMSTTRTREQAHPPGCAPCAHTARIFRRIDRSAPADWFTDTPERS